MKNNIETTHKQNAIKLYQKIYNMQKKRKSLTIEDAIDMIYEYNGTSTFNDFFNMKKKAQYEYIIYMKTLKMIYFDDMKKIN